MELLLPLLIVFMIGMMFVSSRQRRRQQQQTEQLQGSIVVGDVVRMTSGVSGTVVDVDDEQTLDVEIAPDVITTWLRAAVREKLNPEAESSDADDADDATTGAPAVVDGTPGSTSSAGAAAVDAPTPPADAVGGTPTTGASRNGSEPSGEVSSPRTS
jgi:preprotein translocase subunit YajC